MNVKPHFLLDSSACIRVLRNQTGLGRLPPPAQTGIPIIVAAELWTGVKKNPSGHPHQAARLDAFLGFFQLVDFDASCALHYAEIRASLEAEGKPIGPLDTLIAAQARSLDATLITENIREFKRVKGLKVKAL